MERKEKVEGYAGRRTRNYTKTMCLLSISGRMSGRWGFYESLGRVPTRWSVVVYSRKESGPVAQMTLTLSLASPFHRIIGQPAPRFTAIRFLPPLRAFVLSYCRCFCFLLRVNLLYFPPITSSSPSSLFSPQLVPSPNRSSFSSIRTSIFVQVRMQTRMQWNTWGRNYFGEGGRE